MNTTAIKLQHMADRIKHIKASLMQADAATHKELVDAAMPLLEELESHVDQIETIQELEKQMRDSQA
jgi:hypothetical protein